MSLILNMYLFFSLTLTLVFISDGQVTVKNVLTSDENVSETELCKIIRDNVYKPAKQVNEKQEFVWKTLRSFSDIQYREMVLGTMEQQNGANTFIINTFFGRLYFNKDYILMARTVPGRLHNSIEFFPTVNNTEKPNLNFDYNYKVNVHGQELKVDHFEILTNPYNVPYKWVKGVGKTVPAHAVVCGKEYGLDYYCGRHLNNDWGVWAAKVREGVAYVASFGVKTTTEFDYLVYDSQC